jgi:hypothetical protein
MAPLFREPAKILVRPNRMPGIGTMNARPRASSPASAGFQGEIKQYATCLGWFSLFVKMDLTLQMRMIIINEVA